MSKFSEFINGNKPVLVDFYADWCGPCKMMKPILEELKVKLGDKVSILKVDVDRNQAVAATYNVRNIPTLIIFKSGKVMWRQSGVVPVAELQKVLQGMS